MLMLKLYKRISCKPIRAMNLKATSTFRDLMEPSYFTMQTRVKAVLTCYDSVAWIKHVSIPIR